MKLASVRGVAVDRDALAQPVQEITDVWNRRRENLMLANGRDGGGANELSYGLLAFAEAFALPAIKQERLCEAIGVRSHQNKSRFATVSLRQLFLKTASQNFERLLDRISAVNNDS